MRKGTKIYLAASLVAQGGALVRYVLLARLVGPEELGLAAMLILTAQFFESMSDTGADRFIVQDATGDLPSTQKLVQLAMALRGTFIATALVLSAGLVAKLLGTPSLGPSLMALGIAPLIGGFINLDLRRAQRTGDFRPEAVSTILSELASTAATVAAAWVLRDHTAVVYGLVARAFVLVVVSHVLATGAYGWAFAKSDALRFSTFAGPLVMNGLLLFLGSQGDRLIVGGTVGAAALGQYSAIMLLIFYPAGAISRFLAGIHMPLIARARSDPAAFADQRARLAGRCLVIAAAILVGFTLVGPIVTPLLYGHRFAQPLPMFAGLAFLHAVRLLRFWPTTLALGTGDTVTVLISNLVRVAFLPLTLGAYFLWPSIYTIIAGFVVSEVFGLVVALLLLVRRETVEARPELRRSALFVLIGTATAAGATAVAAHNWLIAAPSIVALAGLLAVLARWERDTLLEAIALARARLLRGR